MSLVVVAGGKGAGGVTTTATVLAAVWPAPPLLADCDPAGGDLAWRLRAADGGWLARDRGVVGLAAAARAGSAGLDVTGQAQPAAGGIPVLVGVESPEQAVTIGPLWPLLADAFARSAVDVVADCGRLMPGLVNRAVVERADLVVLVARATPESVGHLRHALDQVADCRGAEATCRVHVVVIGDPAGLDTAGREVAGALSRSGRAVAAVHGLALDPAAAAALAGEPTRRLDRSRLVSSARRVAAEVCEAARQSRPNRDETTASPVLLTGGG